MRTTSTFLMGLLLCNVFGCNASLHQEPLIPGAAQLFKNSQSTLSNSEKNDIYKATDFMISKEGTQFYFEGAEDYPFDAFVYPLDLNVDGVEEIAIIFGNSYTSGFAGNSSTLFIKNKNGLFEPNFGFPGFLMASLSENGRYPDILIDLPNTKAPIWHWNGTQYELLGTVKKEESTLSAYKNVYALSEQYVTGIKKN